MSTPKQHKSKLESRADSYVFIGYSPCQKGYKVLHPPTQKIIVFRDVVFHEQHFPYHFQSTTSTFQFFLPTTTNFTPYIDLPDIFQTSSPSHSSPTPSNSTLNHPSPDSIPSIPSPSTPSSSSISQPDPVN